MDTQKIWLKQKILSRRLLMPILELEHFEDEDSSSQLTSHIQESACTDKCFLNVRRLSCGDIGLRARGVCVSAMVGTEQNELIS
jgi:hypothetical protein